MCQLAYDFSTGIPLNLLIIYGKDPNFKTAFYQMLISFLSLLQQKHTNRTRLFIRNYSL